MQETTPIFDALWEKYNATPIYDRVLLEHDQKKYKEIVREEYGEYSLNENRVWDPAGFAEMMIKNEVLAKEQIKLLFNIPPTDAERLMFGKHPEIREIPRMSYDDWQKSFLNPPSQPKEKPLMNTWQRLVNEFRAAMDLPVPEGPRQLTEAEAEMHIKMIRDEFEKEFVPAARDNDLLAFYDAGIDVIVYIIGAMSNAGFDLDPGFKEIMKSNMTKVDPETGKVLRSRGEEFDGEPMGKVLKGPFYKPPVLGPILNDMTRYGHEDNTVYRTKKIPLTLGIGGPQIGEGDIRIDHNGGMFFEGTMDVRTSLPIIDHLGYEVSAISVGPDEINDSDLIHYNDISYIGEDGEVHNTSEARGMAWRDAFTDEDVAASLTKPVEAVRIGVDDISEINDKIIKRADNEEKERG